MRRKANHTNAESNSNASANDNNSSISSISSDNNDDSDDNNDNNDNNDTNDDNRGDHLVRRSNAMNICGSSQTAAAQSSPYLQKDTQGKALPSR